MSICNNAPNQPQPTKKVSGSLTAKRVAGFYDDLRNRAGVLSSAKDIELRLQEDYSVLATAAAHLPTLRNYNKLSNTLASALGWKSMLWHAPDLGMTEAGAVRYTLRDRMNVAANLVETLALYRAVPKIKQLYNEYQRALPNIEPKQLQTLLHDHVVIGQFPKLYETVDSPIARQQLELRYQGHLQKLQDLGVSPVARQSLDQLAGAVSGTFDELRQVAGQNGLDISTIRNGGYFPLKSDEAIDRILRKVNETANLKGKVNAPGLSTSEAIRKARLTNVPIVVDLEHVADALGVQTEELADVLTRPGEFTKLLDGKVTAEELHEMLQNGYIAQTPALSDELTQLYKDNLQLPIDGLAEAVILDPVQAVRRYASELKDGVRNSKLVQTILTEGIDAGWVTHEGAAKGNKNFIRLGSQSFLRDLLPAGFGDNSLTSAVGDFFVHRTVADQARALLDLNRSWADLGVLGSYFQNFTSIYKKSAILQSGLGYVQRLIGQNAISIYASSGDLSHLAVAGRDIAQVMFKGGFEALDNTRTFATIGGTKYTLKELFIASLVKRGTDTLSGAEHKLDKLKDVSFFNQLRPESLKRFYAMTKAYNDRFGNPATGDILTHAQLLKQMVSGTFNGLYSGLAFLNQTADYGARWAAIRSLASNGERKFKDLDELLRYTDDYFNIHEDVGSLGKVYGSVGQPFAAFAIAAPGSALRYTLQHPYRAANLAYVYSHFSQDSQLTDAELQQWQKDKTMVSLYTDPDTGKQYAVTPGSIDFYQDTYDWLHNLGNSAARALGAPAGSIQQQVEQQQNPLKPFEDFARDSFGKTYFANLLLPALGLDPKTYEQQLEPEAQDTLLGIPIQRQLRSVLVNAFPLLRTADEKLPSSIVGQKQKDDANTLRTIKPGEPGWLGFVPSSGGHKDKAFEPSLFDSQQTISWFLSNGVGLSLQEIDPGKNLIKSYNDFGKANADISKTINTIGVRLVNEKLPDEQRQALAEQQNQLLRLSYFLKYQQYLVNQLASKRGLPIPQATEMVLKLRNSYYKPDSFAPAYEFLRHEGLIPTVPSYDKYKVNTSNGSSN